ncbi:reverse transcriptase domain-containing protein [Tanacetum coccineum]
MAAAAMKYMASNFAKLDKFEGVDFRRWQKKMHFLLSSMSVVYVLTTPMPEDGGDDATVEQIRKRPTKNHQASIQNLETKFDRLADKQSGRPSGSLPSNTQPNPKGHNSKAYQPPQSRNEHVNAVFTRSGKSYNPPVKPIDQQDNSETPINFDNDDEDDEPTPQPKTQNPKPAKETPLPKPYKPKIPYPQRLRTSKNLYIRKNGAQYGKSSSSDPATSNQSENMLVEVGKFTFPADFVILKIEEDSKVPLIWGRPFFHTADAIIRVKQKQLHLGEDFDTLLDEGSKILHSIEGTLLEEEIFAEFDEFMALTADENFDSKSDTEDPPFEKMSINTDYKSRHPGRTPRILT